MKKLIAMCAFIVVAAALLAPAAALAAGRQAGETGRQASVSGVHAGVTCHDPCDDPFQLKAWVRGGDVRGLKVQFVVEGRVFQSGPYAELPGQRLRFLPLYFAFSGTGGGA